MSAPPLPSLRALTAELRALHEAWSHPEAGGEYVRLAREYNPDTLAHEWKVRVIHSAYARMRPAVGREYIPGSVERECVICFGSGRDWQYEDNDCNECNGTGRTHAPSPFDAVAAARRLLAAARDGGAR